jgi:hypothetical protein
MLRLYFKMKVSVVYDLVCSIAINTAYNYALKMFK